MERPSNASLASEATINDENDFIVQHLINIVDIGTFSIGITIFANGIINLESLIVSKSYFDGIIHQLLQSNDTTLLLMKWTQNKAIKKTFSFMEASNQYCTKNQSPVIARANELHPSG